MSVPLVAINDRSLRIASYLIAAVGLWAILWLHLLPTLVAGLFVYVLVQVISPLLSRHVSNANARLLVVALLAVIVVGICVLLGIRIAALLENELGRPETMWEQQLMPLLDKARQQLPQEWVAQLPTGVDELRLMAMDALRSHTKALQTVGTESVRVLVHILIGLVLGGIFALSSTLSTPPEGPLSAALGQRCRYLADSFHSVVFAQVKISALNTVFTGLFLLVVLPLFDIHLPLAKTLVLLTFVIGLLPVIGNLITNVAITIAGLSVSLGVGAVALIYLILIHKLEYFLNARIVGGEIKARAWELLIAMLVMEAAFGLPGVIAAPIYYAYLKLELKTAGLV